MSNTTIQIKRSAVALAPTSLANGELAYSGNSQSNALFIGMPDGSNTVTVIGGGKYGFLHNANTSNATHNVVEGGKLTANAVVITNANGFVNELRTNKLRVGGDDTTANITAINAVSNATHLGSASNTELATTYAIKKYVDDSMVAAGAASNLDGLSDVTLSSVANNDLLVYDAGTTQWVNRTIEGTTKEVEVTFSGQNITIGLPDNVELTGNIVAVGFSGNGANITSVDAETLEGDTLSDIQQYADDAAANAYANAIAYSGAADTAYANAVTYADNAAANAYANAVTYADGVQSNAELYADGVAGDAYANAVYDAAIDASDKAANAYANAISYAGGAADDAYSNAVSYADLTFAPLAGATFTGAVVINANTTLGNSKTDKITVTGSIASSIIPDANVTHSLGNNTLRFNEVYAQNVHSYDGYFEHNVQIDGDLIVTGNVVTIDVSSLQVQDPLIYLAGNNYASDLVDIGFVGNYNDGVTNRHAGVVRHAASDSFYIFKNYTEEPDSNVIDINHASFALADVYAYLISGGLTSNATNVTITANSTLAVAITANSITSGSLSLTNALTVENGGTGKSTLTSGAVLVGNTTGAITEVSSSTEGHVLQISGGVPAFGALDGGSF